MRSVRSVRAIHAALLIGLVATACSASTAQNGVNVKTVATDLTYGVPKTPPPAEPANQAPIPPNPLPVKVVVGPQTTLPPLPGPPPNPCPAAALTDFPSAAPSDVQGMPAAGTYVWRVGGSQKVASIGNVPLPTSSNRKVSGVTSNPNGFTFSVKERELVFGSTYDVTTTYEYIAKGSRTQHSGLFLTKIVRQSRSDSTSSSTFAPSPPVLFLPTPAQIGAKTDSVGVDPVTLEVLRVTGRVVTRKHVDACGKVVDSFYVDSQQQYAAGSTTSTREFDYGIATGLGALPVVERVESPCVADANGNCTKSAVTFHMDAHIGQLKPSEN